MTRFERDGDAPRLETLAVTHGENADASDGPADVTQPIHLASTYALDGIDPDATLDDLDPAAGNYLYSRLANPTRQAVETRLAGFCGGDDALAFASGTSAITTTALATVEPGDHVVAFDDTYGGTRRLLDELFDDRLGVDVSFVDATDPENVRDAVRPDTALVWMETPTNPLMRLCDVTAIADVAHDNDAVLGVDNTFATPCFQRPLDLGADVVVHSTTKYLNGHSDAVGGVAVTDDHDLAGRLGFLQQVGVGNPMPPFDAYMVLRGTRTLPLRMRQHDANARELAPFLHGHDHVTAVHYPGLDAHPQHDLAARQMRGYGGVLSLELDGGVDAAQRFVAALEEFTLAVSLGGVESLVEHPASMTHSVVDPDVRDHLGITDGLLRLSVGVEHVDDLRRDLERGFAALD